ncbi:Nn.00g060020.m01.CDS01 [Neocucurbitaria sp. VM-36]
MPTFLDAFFLSITSTTPLPCESGSATRDSIATNRPYTRSQAQHTSQSTTHLPLFHSQAPVITSQRKGSQKPDFNIFVDTNIANQTECPTRKESKPDFRLPLASRSDSANSTPSPSPRALDTPFPLSSADPCWTNFENYNAQPFITPPPTPIGVSPTHSPQPPKIRRTSRIPRPRRAVVAAKLATPKSVILYNILGLKDWKASTKCIEAAWRKKALKHHPDRVVEEKRDSATLKMQQLNAAKDLLSDTGRRHQYHRDGKLPWVV